ncbi:hypothetical protein GCM10010383_29210 [Streptomyces lomondensis]|uniref:Uncharacterized protein n=1 Tax=Streptomyces lomondensis TaxID=68229 RepID=A0ABQ2X3J9_9ACTN|nr:hypothetical protein GCM10010383_29210 [Streptomyces lomondensis]
MLPVLPTSVPPSTILTCRSFVRTRGSYDVAQADTRQSPRGTQPMYASPRTSHPSTAWRTRCTAVAHVAQQGPHTGHLGNRAADSRLVLAGSQRLLLPLLTHV